ncbi:hypothetical protein Ancab_023756 [Ancistrocladus abbreviatus]
MELPPSPVLGSGGHLAYVQVGLGYDGSSNDHRVVVIAYSWHIPDVSVEMFSLNTGCWKSIACGTQHPYFGFQGVQMFVEGAIYWKGRDLRVTYPERKDYQILSFDVVDEMISCIDLPPNADGGDWVDFSLAVLGGSLVILDTFKKQHCIWELDKHGVDVSWIKRYTIDLQGLFKLVCLTKNHKLLFAREDEGVKSYDIKSREIKKLAKTYPRKAYYSDVYVESLVLVKGIAGETM